jgi:MFS family permease
VFRALRGARLGLLREAPGFRLLFLATLASSIGTWLAVVALVVDVYDRTQDAAWISALLIVEFLPLVVIGLLAGPLIDRLHRRSILIGADLARAAVFFVLPFATGAFQIVLLALAAGFATSFFRPAQYAALPNLVEDRDLPQANGLVQSAENLTWMLGSLAGGALVAATSPDVAYVFNAVTFLLSALLIVRIRRSFEEQTAEPRPGGLRELREGLTLAVRSRALLTVLVAWSIVMLGNAGVNVAEIVLAKDVFSAGDFGYGILLAAGGAGLVLGSVFGGGWIEQRGMRTPYAASIALMAVGYGLAAMSPNVWTAVPAVVLAGGGNGVAVICNALLVQRGVADRLRGRAFTVVMSLGYAVLGLGMIAAGPLTNALGARAVWALSAGLFALAAAAGLALVRGLEESVARPPGDREEQISAPPPVRIEESGSRVG